MNTTTLCPKHPFGHQWDAGLVCALCDATRTAHQAIASGLASARGWNEAAARRALDAHRADLLRGAADALDVSETLRDLTDDHMSDVHAAANELRRMAGEPAPAAELTVYRASHDSIDMGLYTTRQAAYEHCEAYEQRDDRVSPMSWKVDEDGVAELFRIRIPRSPGAESATGYVVTPLTVASAYDEEADE